MNGGYDFDVAVSFAGPDRRFVHEVVRRLKSGGVTVFYDEDHTATLWGENLVDLLHSIYSRRARYTMVFVSRHYLQSAWATHERRSAQERAFG
ncbi:MAG TPA: TIR domain-containing protein, partial [Pseudonocardiaceae bacterium]